MSDFDRFRPSDLIRYRTRSTCPGCATPYRRHARICATCGRTRDRLSDEEIAAMIAETTRRREADRERRRVAVMKLTPTRVDVLY